MDPLPRSQSTTLSVAALSGWLEQPWFPWLHENIPPEWQWFNFALSIVAFLVGVVAVPSVFQMFWGKPFLASECRERFDIGAGAKRLEWQLFNRPIDNRALLTLGVVRSPVEDIFGAVEIREAGTNRLVVRDVALLASVDDEPRLRQRLTASGLPLSVEVVKFVEAERRTFASFGDPDGQELPPGDYRMEVHLNADGQVRTYSAGFSVGRDASGLKWLPARRRH